MPKNACRRSLLLLVLVAVLPWLTGCEPDIKTQRPPEAEVRALLLEVLGPERGEVAEMPLAMRVEPEDEAAFYRVADEAERAALFLPPPIPEVAIEEMRSKWYPAWRVLFTQREEENRSLFFAAHVVDIDDRLHLVLQWRPALRLESGEIRPDVRPLPGRGELATDEKVTVALLPHWDPR